MKPILFTSHAMERMLERDTQKEEVEWAIRNGNWQDAKEGRFMCIWSFPYNKEHYGRLYRCKDVMPIFADEEGEIVVITVITLFSQKEVNDEIEL